MRPREGSRAQAGTDLSQHLMHTLVSTHIWLFCVMPVCRPFLPLARSLVLYARSYSQGLPSLFPSMWLSSQRGLVEWTVITLDKLCCKCAGLLAWQVRKKLAGDLAKLLHLRDEETQTEETLCFKVRSPGRSQKADPEMWTGTPAMQVAGGNHPVPTDFSFILQLGS